MVKEFSYAGYSVSRNKRPAWHFVLIALAALVVFITTYLLILPAFTMERVPQCGLTEHTHVDLCYEDRAVLVCEEAETEGHAHGEGCYEAIGYLCGLEESEGHGHSQACYEERPLLICELEESEEHTHGESCFGTELALACGLEEAEGHTHSESCGLPEPVLICEQEERIGHVHGEDCYVQERTLICAFPEHTHTDLCYEQSNPEADLESAADWERTFRDVELSGDWNADVIAIAETQLGYKESTRNFLWSEAGEKQGYSRYGDWYGIPYGDWCAMFASFCLHYAEVPSVPTEETPVYVPAAAGCEAWVEQLDELGCYASARDTIPEPGDIVFFDFDSDPTADHVGLVYELITDEESGRVTALKTIEGNWNDCVCSNTYDLTASALLGYGRLPLNPFALENGEEQTPSAVMTRTVHGEDYTIRVRFTEEAGLPDDTELTARELTGQEYEQKLEQARIAAGLTEVSFARFFDITFLSNGQEIEPTAPVEVVITYHDGLKLDGEESGSAVHFTENGPEVLDVQTREEADGSTSVTFEQGSFSTTGTVYGVSLLAEDDGIAAYAEGDWSDPPPVGNLTGTVVTAPIIGEWYMLYGYNGANNSYVLPESWPNRGSLNPYATSACPKLSAASDQLGGTVTYTGQADMAWQYIGDGGFQNRYGYKMYMTTSRSGTEGSYSYTTAFSVATNLQNNQLPLKYSWDRKAFYTVPSGVSYNKYNILTITSNGYSDHGVPTDSLVSPDTLGNGGLTHYLAQVTGLDNTNIANGNHPPATVTGTAELGKPVLYSMDGTSAVKMPIAGVEYTIRNQSGQIVLTVVTNGRSIDNIVSGLAPGTYTVEQTKVPNGYVVTPQKRTITIGSGGNGYIGNFFVYTNESFASDKTAQVINYEDRIYQVELTGQSGRIEYETDPPIHLDLIVDVSNSMLFPAELVDTGKEVSLRLDGSGNDTRLNNLNLDKKKTYYFIADTNTTVNPAATSTVYALYWCGNAWVYQDASFYSKAYRHWEKGDEVNVKNKVANSNPSRDDYVQYVQAGDSYDQRDSRGGDVTKSMSGCTAIANSYRTTAGGATAASHTFKLYTATEYNRLHELQQAVATLGSMVQSIDPTSKIRIETFAKEVYECNEYTMDNAGLMGLLTFVNNLTTEGGTRQDLALKHLIGDQSNTKGTTHKSNHLDNTGSRADYVILITDGAPNTTNAATTINEIVSLAGTIKSNYLSGYDRLITIGLSSEDIAGNMLPQAASGPEYYKKVEESGQLTQYFIDLFYSEFMSRRKVITSQADVIDEVSDSFYITNATGTALKAGSRIDLNGNPDSNGPGLICYEDGQWYVKWENQTLGTGVEANPGTTVYTYTDGNGKSTEVDPSKIYYIDWSNGKNILGSVESRNNTRDQLVFRDGTWLYAWRDQSNRVGATESAMGRISASTTGATLASPAWKGHVYLKAKEDFIGGNVIDSNKEAGVYIREGDYVSENPLRPLPTPTLNVRLLPMEGFESEETLFLGDEVTDIQGKLQTLLEKTVVRKIKDGLEDPLNKSGKGEADGLYADQFTIPYAIRDLTEAEWTQLLDGQPVKVDYTYDDASSHGAVGYFTFQLNKKGASVSTDNHATTQTGKDVETYTLEVSYTAYRLNESDAAGIWRPNGNVHNGANGPGTVVGRGLTIPTGLGTESVDEIHHVHVIDGEIFLTKVIDQSLVSDENQTYVFDLFEKDEATGEAKGDSMQTVTVTVPAGKTMGTIRIYGLPRNHYLVKEAEGDYVVQQVEVVTATTSCVARPDMPILEFDIGTNEESTEANKNVIHVLADGPDYRDSLYENEQRYVYSIPFSGPGAIDPTENPTNGFKQVDKATVTTLSAGHGEITNAPARYTAELEVRKSWSDGSDSHSKDEVLVVLFNGEGTAVMDSEGNAMMLRLNAGNGWRARFTIAAPQANYNPIAAGYYVREVAKTSQTEADGYLKALAVNADQAESVYVQVAEENEIVVIHGSGYSVHYETLPGDRALVVTNKKAYELPKTGGAGTTVFTIGGITLMAAAVISGIGLRRRRGRRFNE